MYSCNPLGSSISSSYQTNDFSLILTKCYESLYISPNCAALNSLTLILNSAIPYFAASLLFKSATVLTLPSISNWNYSPSEKSICSSITDAIPFLTITVPFDDFPYSMCMYSTFTNLRSVNLFLYDVISETACWDFFMRNSSTPMLIIYDIFCFNYPKVLRVSIKIS